MFDQKLEYPVSKYISSLSCLFNHISDMESKFGGDSRLKTIASRSLTCAFSDLTLTHRIEKFFVVSLELI